MAASAASTARRWRASKSRRAARFRATSASKPDRRAASRSTSSACASGASWIICADAADRRASMASSAAIVPTRSTSLRITRSAAWRAARASTAWPTAVTHRARSRRASSTSAPRKARVQACMNPLPSRTGVASATVVRKAVSASATCPAVSSDSTCTRAAAARSSAPRSRMAPMPKKIAAPGKPSAATMVAVLRRCTVVLVLATSDQRFPRRSCSSSRLSKSALKLPLPKLWLPRRQMISKNRVGRSWSGLLKSCRR